MNVLGIEFGGHDPGAAVMANRKVVAIAEERLNRIKYAPMMFPELSIPYCMRESGISAADLDLVVYDTTANDRGAASSQAIEEYLREKLIALLGSPCGSVRIARVNHHDAHAAAAFFCSPFEDAALLVYDGMGETSVGKFGLRTCETESLYRGTGSSICTIQKVLHGRTRDHDDTIGIGQLYEYLSSVYLGLGYLSAGKMMGLAAYGGDSFLRRFPIDRWVTERSGEIVANGLLKFRPSARLSKAMGRGLKQTLVVAYYWGRIKTLLLGRALKSFLFGRDNTDADSRIFLPIVMPQPARNPQKDELPDTYYASVAYVAQKVFEHFAEELGKKLRAVTQSENICVAGGCALNIDANRNFLTKVGFKNIFVQPASSDCGIALGCALWGMHMILKQPRMWEMKNASLGRRYTREEILATIKARKDEVQWRESADVAKEAAGLIADNKILGWFQGGSEYGPRALGNRSILCDARNSDMKDILNKRVKHREMWRPFAASVLLESVSEWFDLDTPSPFMLLTGTVPQEKRSEVPSIVHVDGTCRIQSLTREDNGIYYTLVKEFQMLTGIPMILNTSFNLGGDPIVESPADALDTFLRTDMDYLVLESMIVEKIVRKV